MGVNSTQLNRSCKVFPLVLYTNIYIYDKGLEGAHNGLADAKAQTDIVLHSHLLGYW